MSDTDVPAPGSPWSDAVGDLGPLHDPAMVRHLVDDATILFVALDGAADIAWIGRSSEAVLGRSPSELIGTSGLDLLHPDDHDILLASLAESARNADERIFAVVRVRHADGTWLTLEFGGLDRRDEDGSGTFLVWGRSHESATRLTAFLEALLTGGDLGQLLGEVVHWCDALMPYSTSIILARRDDGTYRCPIDAPGLPSTLGADLVVDLDATGSWRDLAGAEVVEASLSELPEAVATAATDEGVATAWLVAIAGADPARPDGLLVSWRRRPGSLLATHRRHLQEACRLSQLAFGWGRSHSDLVTAATTDSLTGVANRTRLGQVVEADRSETSTLLFCDLDHFKELNDRHGHAAGDQVLRAVAARMQAAVRSGDLLARLGGDEFSVWCPDLAGGEVARQVAGRIIDAFALPVEVDGRAHLVRCSIGIASVSRDHGRPFDLHGAIKRADAALYRAKAAGRGRWAEAD